MDRIPILKMGPHLLVTIQVDMHDQMAMALQEDLTARIDKEKVVGMQPAVAITLVELGLSLQGVRTALNVERGMQILARRVEAERGSRRPPEVRGAGND